MSASTGAVSATSTLGDNLERVFDFVSAKELVTRVALTSSKFANVISSKSRHREREVCCADASEASRVRALFSQVTVLYEFPQDLAERYERSAKLAAGLPVPSLRLLPLTKDTAALLPHLTRLSLSLERDSNLAEIAAHMSLAAGLPVPSHRLLPLTKDTATLLPHLTRLSLSLERDSDLAEIAARVGCHSSLTELRLESRSERDTVVGFLQPAEYFPRLTHLWISFLTVRCPPPVSSRSGGTQKLYTELKELRMSGCVYLGEMRGLVEYLPPCLEVLKLPRDVSVKMTCARKIVEKCRNSLRELRISSVPECRAFILNSLPNLTFHSDTYDIQLSSLTAQSYANIRELSTESCPIEIVAALFPNVEVLDCWSPSYKCLDPEGADPSACALAELRVLRKKSEWRTPELEQLRHFPKLEEITLNSKPFSQAKWHELSAEAAQSAFDTLLGALEHTSVRRLSICTNRHITADMIGALARRLPLDWLEVQLGGTDSGGAKEENLLPLHQLQNCLLRTQDDVQRPKGFVVRKGDFICINHRVINTAANLVAYG